jgi:hypothetical protein
LKINYIQANLIIELVYEKRFIESKTNNFLLSEDIYRECLEEIPDENLLFINYIYFLKENIYNIGWYKLMSLRHDKENPILSIKKTQNDIKFFISLIIKFYNNNKKKEYKELENFIEKMSLTIEIKESININKDKFNRLDDYWYSSNFLIIKRILADYLLKNDMINEEIVKRDYPSYHTYNQIKNF